MQGWWTNLDPWKQAAYVCAGLVMAYLVGFIPWSWLEWLPLSNKDWLGKGASGDGPIDTGSSDDRGAGWFGLGGGHHSDGGGHGDAGHGGHSSG